MDFSMDIMNVMAILLITIGILVVLVNIITEIVKYVFEIKEAKKINIFVLILSEVMAITLFLAFCQINNLLIMWYMIVAVIILGALVAYAAMLGYDKLLSNFIEINKLISLFKGKKNENKS